MIGVIVHNSLDQQYQETGKYIDHHFCFKTKRLIYLAIELHRLFPSPTSLEKVIEIFSYMYYLQPRNYQLSKA